MEAHERIGVQPVAPRPVTPVDQHDLGVAVRDQRVGEGHPRCTGSDDEVGRSHGGRGGRGAWRRQVRGSTSEHWTWARIAPVKPKLGKGFAADRRSENRKAPFPVLFQ